MFRRVRPSLLLSMFLLVCVSASAQTRIGIYNSVKGLGVSAEFVSKENTAESDLISVYTDTYGVFSGRSKFWGVMASYRHEYSFFKTDYEFLSLELHSGAGFIAGYVRDYEEGTFSLNTPALTKNPGLCFGVSGNIGARIFFDRAISLDVSFSIDPGMHIRADNESGNLMVSLYNNGIYHFIYPELRLFYNF